MEVSVKNDDFMCRCSEKEGARSQSVFDLAKELLSEGMDEEYTSAPCWLIDSMIYELTIHGELRFVADQWAGVHYTRHEYDTKAGKVLDAGSCYIQCDRPTDGLAAAVVWKHQEERAKRC